MLRISAIMLRQYYLMHDNPTRVLQIFVWILVDILLWGFLTMYLNDIADVSFSFIPLLLGAVLLWDFLVRVMHGVTTAFLEDVWSRNFLNIFASPLEISEYIIGIIITSIATSTIGLLAMLALAALFGFSLFSFGALVTPFLLILFLFGTALGAFGMALLLRFGPAAEWLIWPIGAVLSPFVGVLYPIELLPSWMQIVAHVLPPTYVFEGVRAIVAGQPFVMADLFWGTVLTILYLVGSYLFFVRIYRRAIRTGLLARYSAETVS